MSKTPPAWLVLDADNSVRIELSEPKVTLGRETNPGAILNIPVMSRVHCTLERVGPDWIISDENSRNGTWVNQRRVTRQTLRDGDRITFGVGRQDSVSFHGAPQRVVFEEDSADIRQSIMASVNLDGLFNEAEQPSVFGALLEPIPAFAGADASTRDSIPIPILLDSASVIRLFSQMGEALLTSESLSDMLEKAIDLAFDSLPAQRGSICLYDEKTASLSPQATRRGRVKSPIRISRSIVNAVTTSKSSILVVDTKADERFSKAASIAQMQIHSAMCAPMYRNGCVLGIVYVDTQTEGLSFTEQHLGILTALSVFAAVGVEQARLREDVEHEKMIRSRLARYSSPGVVDQIVSAGGEMAPEEKELSVLFADLQGFTSMSESMEPAAVARILNCVFERLTKIIFSFQGTLDKFMGDAVMAIFGAPLQQVDHAERAIRAALMMQEALQDMNRDEPNMPFLRMRIGINSGRAVVGDIGSPDRKDYSVIGDTVNVASRLESSVAEPDQVVIGPTTYEMIKGQFEVEKLSEIQLKGKHQHVQPYRVLRAMDETLPIGPTT